MKKIATIMGLFGLIFVQAQVGINTDTPKATLDMKKDQSLAETTPQGLLLPKLTTAERAKFSDVEEGMMIYNLDKKCVEIYTGIKSGIAQWDCMTRTTSPSAQNIAVTPAGFEGVYMPNEAMTAANKVKFKLKNNSFSEISNIDFSEAVGIVGGGLVHVNSTENSSVSLAPGASTVLSYSLRGRLDRRTLAVKFNKLSLQAEQSTQVGLGTATIADKTAYVTSLTTGGTTIQGEINNLPEKMTIDIPYTQGRGSYHAFTSTKAVGQGENARNLKLDIPAGNFGDNGNLTATITVDRDGKYLVEQQLLGAESTIATFDVTAGSSTFKVFVKGIGGVPDRKYGNGTHDFLYLPVEVTGTYPVLNRTYKKIWLNMNLGAAYAKVGSPDFNIFVNKSGSTMHSDSKLYGSYFTFDEAQLACPEGYHLPTAKEWRDLHEAVTGTRAAVANSKFWNQTDIPNFAAAGDLMPGDLLIDQNRFGYYWSSEKYNNKIAFNVYFRSNLSFPDKAYHNWKEYRFSARCLKD